MRVAFWNINTGIYSSQEKQQVFSNWVQEMNLDLLFLEEVSFRLENLIENWTHMERVEHVNTRDKNLDPSTKQLWVLQRTGSDFKGKALRFPRPEAKRMYLKVYSRTYGFTMRGLHVNASYNAKYSVEEIINLLQKNTSEAVGGDFNYSIDYVATNGGQACHPLSWEGKPLKFSQWKYEYGTPMKYPDPNFHFQTMNIGFCTIKPSPNGVIDFVMYGTGRTVVARKNCLTENRWVDILKNFDHCPVVYDIT